MKFIIGRLHFRVFQYWGEGGQDPPTPLRFPPLGSMLMADSPTTVSPVTLALYLSTLDSSWLLSSAAVTSWFPQSVAVPTLCHCFACLSLHSQCVKVGVPPLCSWIFVNIPLLPSQHFVFINGNFLQPLSFSSALGVQSFPCYCHS